MCLSLAMICRLQFGTLVTVQWLLTLSLQLLHTIKTFAVFLFTAVPYFELDRSLNIILYSIKNSKLKPTGLSQHTHRNQQHLQLQFTPGCSIFSFLCSVLQIVVCHFVLFLFVIVWSVLLRFMIYYYPFDIFKVFLQ